jgi:hypothetical protein
MLFRIHFRYLYVKRRFMFDIISDCPQPIKIQQPVTAGSYDAITRPACCNTCSVDPTCQDLRRHSAGIVTFTISTLFAVGCDVTVWQTDRSRRTVAGASVQAATACLWVNASIQSHLAATVTRCSGCLACLTSSSRQSNASTRWRHWQWRRVGDDGINEWMDQQKKLASCWRLYVTSTVK